MNGQQDVSMLLSRKMLLGWTLLDVVCAKCQIVPLVEDKKNNVVQCVNCNRSLKRDKETGDLVVVSQGPTQQQQQQQQQTTTTTSSTQQQQNEFMPGLLRTPAPSATPAQAQFTTTTPSTQQTSSVMQQHDLDMDDDEIEDDYFDDDKEATWTESERIAFEKRMKKSDEVSAIMGQKLLMGWALLGDECPNNECSGTPLMRDREKMYHCVSCEASAMSVEQMFKAVQTKEIKKQQDQAQSQAQSQIQEVTPTKEPKLKRQKKVVDPEPMQLPAHQQHVVPDNCCNTLAGASSSSPLSTSTSLSTTPHKATTAPLAPAASTRPNINNNNVVKRMDTSSSSSSSSHQELNEMPDVVDRALQTLLHKLSEAESRLANSTSINDTKNDCSLIKECSQAIASLLELKRQLS
ncbi:hypothetical protein SAMD00019534_084430 [Acytostelium subglobosum LB1]|uniref:hypothetical protein n=1 Tax=Acytostelium subglobosum LB1 TaxID=1410327 RepID=UPI000644B28E|nr:hypothetical protein SAMD00019534_084430 [Acytostelium subglobosum LB1]GAM25268.1 hypothetical protein SAMD00019534_084430 [Acytostelium subglobosum LB1]|eukprot:XP_012751788.1 hypothetical protein SAMD00019534_084430 [Acytostelium subglobosum LB1]